MKKVDKKDRWIDLNSLPKLSNNNCIDWDACKNIKLKFKYGIIEDDLILLDYKKKTHQIYVKYLDEEPYLIRTDCLKKCKLGELLKYNEFKYNINQEVISDNASYIILDRRISQNNDGIFYKEYLCKCLECEYTYWKTEKGVLKGCSCCSRKVVVRGINDIPTTDSWMVKYFQGGYDEASQYTCRSGKKIYPICPDCGRVKDKPMQINTIYTCRSIGCKCSDKISYPEKFMMSILDQLNINYIYQLSKMDYLWCKKYKYDFYLLDYNIIIETHGGQHYSGNNGWCKSEKQKEIDLEKYNNAKNFIDDYICIDCSKSEKNYIKQSVINSKLNTLLNLNDINWEICDLHAIKNIIKEVCIFWEENNQPNYNIVKNKFHLCSATIKNYLYKGSKFGWCNYYNGIYADKLKRKVNVYDVNNNYMGTYLGISELAKCSEEIFGIKFSSTMINYACNGKYKTYKGYIFEWAN